MVLPANFEEIVIGGLIAKLKKFYKEENVNTIFADDITIFKLK